MSWSAYVIAVLALLVSPGPTNTLLFLAGTERGWRGALRLIPAELAGYLAVVVPLAALGAEVMAEVPLARPVLSVAAGVWVAVLAVRLWRPGTGHAAGPSVTARRVLVTTLLNPKALIFGLVLLPAAPALPAATLAFAAMVAGVAALWAAAGAAVAGGAARLIPWVQRAAALWLGLLAAGLLARGLAP